MDVAKRTEVVYDQALRSEDDDLLLRLGRYVMMHCTLLRTVGVHACISQSFASSHTLFAPHPLSTNRMLITCE